MQLMRPQTVTVVCKNPDHGISCQTAVFFLWSEDQINACKVADKFATANKDTFAIKAGVIEGKAADVNTVNAFAKLPGREELLGMLLNVWNGPARSFAIGLQALATKKEEEA